MALAPKIQQGIAGAAVKALHSAASRQQADVADAADVEHRPRLGSIGPQGSMKGRNQRRALAAGSHVSVAEIGNHIHAGELGQQRRVVQLQCVAGAKSLRLVPYSLAVSAYGNDVLAMNALNRGNLQQTLNHTCIDTGQLVGCQCGAVKFIGAGAVEREQFRFEVWIKRLAGSSPYQAGRIG